MAKRRRPPKVPADNGPVRVRVGLKVRPKGREAQLTLARLHAMLDDSSAGIYALVREAVIQDLMPAYATRFKGSTDKQKLVTGDPELNADTRSRLLRRVVRLERAISEVIAKPSGRQSEQYTTLTEMQDRAILAYAGYRVPREYKGKERIVNGEKVTQAPRRLSDMVPPSAGSFSEKKQDVINELINRDRMRNTSRRVDRVQVSFGAIDALDRIQTSDVSESEVNTMWRQLEFGSGVFAKPAGNAVAVPRLVGSPLPSDPRHHSKERYNPFRKAWEQLGDGSWMLNNIRVLGSRPGNFLRDQTGAMYTGYALQFSSSFRQRLSAALNRLG